MNKEHVHLDKNISSSKTLQNEKENNQQGSEIFMKNLYVSFTLKQPIW